MDDVAGFSGVVLVFLLGAALGSVATAEWKSGDEQQLIVHGADGTKYKRIMSEDQCRETKLVVDDLISPLGIRSVCDHNPQE